MKSISMIMRQVSEKMTGTQTSRQQNVLKSCIFTNCIFAREFAICFSFAIYAQNKKVIKRFDSNALKNHNSNHLCACAIICNVCDIRKCGVSLNAFISRTSDSNKNICLSNIAILHCVYCMCMDIWRDFFLH